MAGARKHVELGSIGRSRDPLEERLPERKRRRDVVRAPHDERRPREAAGVDRGEGVGARRFERRAPDGRHPLVLARRRRLSKRGQERDLEQPGHEVVGHVVARERLLVGLHPHALTCRRPRRDPRLELAVERPAREPRIIRRERVRVDDDERPDEPRTSQRDLCRQERADRVADEMERPELEPVEQLDRVLEHAVEREGVRRGIPRVPLPEPVEGDDPEAIRERRQVQAEAVERVQRPEIAAVDQHQGLPCSRLVDARRDTVHIDSAKPGRIEAIVHPPDRRRATCRLRSAPSHAGQAQRHRELTARAARSRIARGVAAAAPAQGGATRAGSTGALLRNPNFLPYLIGNTLSGTGTWFQILAQSILIYDLTGSTFLLGVVGFASYGAVFLLAPLTGRVADRYDRQKVLMVSQLVAIAVTGTLCIVTALGKETPAVIIGFAFVLGVSGAFTTPAVMAFVPSLVGREYLSAALALNSVTYNVGRAVGPVLAAVVITSLGPAWAFGINSLSYLALVAALLVVHPLTPHKTPDVVPRLMDSVRIVLRDRRLAFFLYTIAAISVATDPPITLGPAYMVEEYGHRASLSGLLVGAFGTGAVIAAFTIAHRLRGTRVTLMVLLFVTGLGLVVFAVAPPLGLGMLGLVVMGFGYLSSNTAATSRLQLDVSPDHRGRMMVLWSLAFLGARPIGSLIDGAIASWAGVRVATLVMSLPAFAGAAVLFIAGIRARRYAHAPR